MNQSRELLTALKQELKRQGRTYIDVAETLGLSEASVKRMFSRCDFSLERLEKVCGMLQIGIVELVRQMESRRQKLEQLTEAQEQELVSDARLLLVAYLAVNGYGFDEMLQEFHFNDTELIQLLAKLDRLKLIELQPGNRIRRMISPQFQWRAGGPIQRYFTEYLERDFFKSRFDGEGELYLFLPGLLSKASQSALLERLQVVAKQFGEFNENDQRLSSEQRDGYTLILATRPWRPRVFDKFYRSSASRRSD